MLGSGSLTPGLRKLEAQLASLPDGILKDDLEAGFEVMALWLRQQSPEARARVLAELPVWLRDTDPLWHATAVLGLAWRLGDRALLESAVAEAQHLGVQDFTPSPGDQFPSWVSFHLQLIACISRWTGDPGEKARGYLSDLWRGALRSDSYSRRLLGIRARLVECLLQAPARRTDCLQEALTALRAWGDPGILRSALGLLDSCLGHTAEGISELRALLTVEECETAQVGLFLHG